MAMTATVAHRAYAILDLHPVNDRNVPILAVDGCLKLEGHLTGNTKFQPLTSHLLMTALY